jgi:hypothetical protein
MAVFKVPGAFTLHAAVAEAASNHDPDNFIDISGAPIHTTAALEIGADFDAGHRLTIRPDPTIPGLRRALIINTNPAERIISVTQAGYVTFRDLDILRNCTNNEDLFVVFQCVAVTIERCRVGSSWTTTGAEGWSNLFVRGPVGVVVRNSLFFAHRRSTFTYAIRGELGSGLMESLLLYNNVATDHRTYGIYVTAPEIGDQFVLLRNNVAGNHPNADPEPFAYHSGVPATVVVETSHNTAFAEVGQVEEIAPLARSISGEANADFRRISRRRLADSFVERSWIINPLHDPNVDFFRLLNGGPLHHDPLDAGVNVSSGSPHARDVAVTDDVEKDSRPAGLPMHTDRGADQIAHDDLLVNVERVDLVPPMLPGGRSGRGIVRLNGPAVEQGAEIKLEIEGGLGVVPPAVKIPGGAISGAFVITATVVTSSKRVRVTASYRGFSKAAWLTVRPIAPESLSLSRASVTAGENVQGTIRLDSDALPASIEVMLKSGNAAAVVPKSAVIAKNARSATFPVQTKPVSIKTRVEITSTANGVSKSVTLTINPRK